jgi:hypothetical protein
MPRKVMELGVGAHSGSYTIQKVDEDTFRNWLWAQAAQAQRLRRQYMHRTGEQLDMPRPIRLCVRY